MNSNYYRNDKTIWCDKDEQGFAKQIANQKDIFIPFKLELPAGHSIFTVLIPKRYLTRVFSFDNVMLVPIMYSDQAALLNLETESELDEIYKFPISVKALFDKTTDFYPDRFSGLNEHKTIAQLMTAANWFFFQKQPEGLLHTACFFDWMDLRFQPTNEQTFDENIQV